MIKSEQDSLPLAEAIDGFLAREPAYFCIPGHRMERGLDDELLSRFGEGVFRYDLTEASGLDDLHAPKGAIKKAQYLAARLYGAKRTWFLVNGTTCGNEALMLSVAKEGEEVVVFRNAHYSICSALVLSGAKPIWVMPETDARFGFASQANADVLKKTLDAHPHAKAAFVTSPTYYGSVSDIKALADVCHKRNIPLIVDEAHGAHFYFNENFPKGALENGADAVVMSVHKTLTGMTQSSMLHINGELLDEGRIEAALRMTQSSSPSYVLMLSLDAARRQAALCGEAVMQKAFELSMTLRKRLSDIDGIDVYGGCEPKGFAKGDTDPSRVVFSALGLGICGRDFSDRLFAEYGVATEMSDTNCCVAVVTGANTEGDIERFSNAVADIADKAKRSHPKTGAQIIRPDEKLFIPRAAITPRQAFFSEKETVRLCDAADRISARPIAFYPPAIPTLVPGEEIDERALAAISYCIENGIKTHGMSPEYIEVVKQS